MRPIFSRAIIVLLLSLRPYAASGESENVPTLLVEIGQRFEPIVKFYEEVKTDFERGNPGEYYPGFLATVSNKEINNGIPLGASFGTPMKLKLRHQKYSLLFPPGKFFSLNFDSSGELDSARLNPQLAYTNEAESILLIAELNQQLADLGWKQIRKGETSARWLAEWVSIDLYMKTSPDCQAKIDAGELDAQCRLVEISIERLPKLSAEIINCGEIDAGQPILQKEEAGSHSGVVSVMDPLESPRFKPGCPQVSASLGTRFGILVRIEGEDEGELISDLVTRVTHPAFASGTIHDEWNSPMRVGEARYAGWLFEEEAELKAGKWTIEIVLGTEILAMQHFSIAIS